MTDEDRRKSRAHKRQWWQVLCRVAAVAVLALAGAYITLPWWAPTGMIKGWLAAEMARQMGVYVRIESLSLSWARGAELRGLTIDSTPGTGAGPMVEIEAVRMDFSPVDIFLNNRIEWLELHRPRFSVRRAPDGSFNVQRLARLHFEPEPQRITQRRGAVIYSVPGRDEQLRLDIGDLQIFAGKLRGIRRITMAAWLDQGPGTGAAPVTFQLFADRQADPGVAAQAYFSFADVDLEALGLKDVLQLPLERLSGQCRGTAELQLDRQGRVDHCRAELAINNLDVQPRGGPKLPVIARAGFNVSAAIDLLESEETTKIDIRSSPDLNPATDVEQTPAVRLPGIDLERLEVSMSKLVWGRLPQIKSLDLKGKINPGHLTALLRGRKRPADGLVCNDPVVIEKLTLERITRNGPKVTIQLAADASGAKLTRRGKIVKQKGTKLRFEMDGFLDERKWDFHISKSRLELGENWIEQEGQLADVRPFWKSLWKGAGQLGAESLGELSAVSSKGSLHLKEVDSVIALVPPLAPALGELELRGPLSCQWNLSSGSDPTGGADFEANMTVEPAA
ncbi:MAG: AsmA family protein, partial [Planctomycetota bacterium]